MGAKSTVKNTKRLAYASAFAALYLLLSYSTSLIVGPQLRGSDAHLIRAVLMVILAAMIGAKGGPTLMGLISGLLLLGIPSPASFLYLPGSLAAGLVYDASLSLGNYADAARRRRRVILSSILSGLAESIVVTAGFFLMGFSFQEIVSRLAVGGVEFGVAGIWFYSLGKNVVMSTVGASLALALLSRLKARTISSRA